MNIYQDIARRTDGDIYIGVVGPVRTGKSTFITRFMKSMILPEITDKNVATRTIDELPQSADGKTIMTTEPKFVPNEAVRLTLSDKSTANVRLIDCVGYVVDGAEGLEENGKTRLVSTPWNGEPLPFDKAAEIGTEKVVKEHSTVAVVVTTDGSVTGMPRENYLPAEERVVTELQSIGKPFVVVLNSQTPLAESTQAMAKALMEKYGVTVIAVNVLTAEKEQFEEILLSVSGEFPVRRIDVAMPKWMRTLNADNSVIKDIVERIKTTASKTLKMKDVPTIISEFSANDANIELPEIVSANMSNGVVELQIKPREALFYKMLSEEAGTEIDGEYALMNFVTSSAYAKKRFDELKNAIDEADATGYGVVEPKISGATLQQPEVIKQGNLYGVKLKATAPSYHIIRVDVNSEISPIVGSEQQSNYLLKSFGEKPESILQTNMFGKTISALAEDDLHEKCASMSPQIRGKLAKTVNRIVNENRGALICFLL